MKTSQFALILSLASLPFLAGCKVNHLRTGAMPSTEVQHWSNPRDRVPVAMPASGKVEGVPTYGAPFQLPGHRTWISSLVMTKANSFFRDSDPFAEGGLAGSGTASADAALPPQFRSIDVRWHDAVFTDGRGGDSWSLLGQRGFVSHWWLMLNFTDGVPVSQLSIFSAVIDDTNGDGTLDNKDAAVAILTDGNGRNPKIVTPRHLQLASMRYMAESDLIGFEMREDANTDGKFTSDEPVRFYFLDQSMDSPVAKPWHSDGFRQDLESRYR
ncbi:MAG: hypothetical protein P1V35_13875 [Planctomycetota bacterium]|nr:hypothetical protein [Planctomycetota bacterium]